MKTSLAITPAGEAVKTLPYNPAWSFALISDCGRYRYRLERRWEAEGPVVVFVMINPSTADARFDDQTLTRCIKFAKRWGYAGLVIVNLFAIRSSDPLAILEHADAIGPANDNAILSALIAPNVARIVCAWGTSANKALRMKIETRAFAVKTWLRQRDLTASCLGLTQDGKPKHPLARGKARVPDDFDPIPYGGAA